MRETKEIILQDRGNSLTFVIEQMPATKMQKLIAKGLFLLAGTGLAEADFSTLQKEFKNKGFALLRGIDVDKAEELVNELYSCAKHKVDNMQVPLTPQNIDSIITDVRTLFTLEKEILAFNFDFFTESPLNSEKGTGAQGQGNTFDMRTSRLKSV